MIHTKTDRAETQEFCNELTERVLSHTHPITYISVLGPSELSWSKLETSGGGEAVPTFQVTKCSLKTNRNHTKTMLKLKCGQATNSKNIPQNSYQSQICLPAPKTTKRMEQNLNSCHLSFSFLPQMRKASSRVRDTSSWISSSELMSSTQAMSCATLCRSCARPLEPVLPMLAERLRRLPRLSKSFRESPNECWNASSLLSDAICS